MIRSVLKPWTRESTWWSFVHLLCGLPVGYLSTVVVVVGLAVSVSTLVVFPVAFIASWVLFLTAHGLAQLERSRYTAYFGVDFTDPAEQPQGTNPLKRQIARLSSATRWRELLYLLLRLPLSGLQVGLMFIVWSGSLALIGLPMYLKRLPGGSADLGPFSIESTPTALLGAVVGLAVLVYLAPWVTVALAQADQAFGRSLLARGSRTEIEERVVSLESSRVAAIDSAEAERRRIERDLHDGAQQRLIAAAINLGVAKDRIETDPAGARELVVGAHEELKAAMRELRDLVRGIHPVILEDRGLDAALSAVVARSTVPVELSVRVFPRPASTIESAAYFVVCEALANVARHAHAESARVLISGGKGSIRITIDDDGIGGADPTGGTGLRGLAGRVEALGGSLKINSPAGGPTTIEVEIPCES